MIYKIKKIPIKKLVTIIFRYGGKEYDYIYTSVKSIHPGDYVSIYTPNDKKITVEVINVKNYCKHNPKIKYKHAFPVTLENGG